MNKPINVDSAEIEKFSQLAHRWWDKDSEFRPLHAINPIRTDWIKSHVDLQGQRLVDVGCGGGILSESLAQNGAKVLGIDMSVKALKIAKLHALEAGTEGVEYFQSSAEDLAQSEPQSFDVVTCMEMLEHVPDPASVVQACSTLVKPGGWVFLSTINRNLQAFLMAIVGAEYILNMLPRGTHEYAKFIKPSELLGYCNQCGLVEVDLKGLHYNPITQRYWLDGSTQVNYFLALQKQAT